MQYETVILEREEEVATITMNRPEALNALNAALRRDLAAAIAEVRDDPQVRAVILTGTGRGFCAGGDVKDQARGGDPQERREMMRQLSREVIQELMDMPKPVVAAVNGFAVGAGCNLALATDLIVASQEATFSEIFVRVGLVPDLGGLYTLPRQVGMTKAKELIFTGEMIDGREAERIGLVNKAVPPDELASAAKELARRLAKGPTRAMGLAKGILNRSLQSELADVLGREAEAQFQCFQTEDHQEGVAAFLEKREPVFKGR